MLRTARGTEKPQIRVLHRRHRGSYLLRSPPPCHHPPCPATTPLPASEFCPPSGKQTFSICRKPGHQAARAGPHCSLPRWPGSHAHAHVQAHTFSLLALTVQPGGRTRLPGPREKPGCEGLPLVAPGTTAAARAGSSGDLAEPPQNPKGPPPAPLLPARPGHLLSVHSHLSSRTELKTEAQISEVGGGGPRLGGVDEAPIGC